MLDSIKPIIDRWYIFLPIITAVVTLYILELKLKPKALKTVLSVINLLAQASLIVLCVIFETGIEITLLLILICVLIGLLTEGGKRRGI